MEKQFTVDDAKALSEQAKQGVFLTKGKVIDLIRRAAKKGEKSLVIVGLPEDVETSLKSATHKFNIVTKDGSSIISGW